MEDPVSAKFDARRSLQMGAAVEAAARLKSVLQANPADAEANGLMGAALSQTGDVASAVAYFEQAVRLEPARSANHYNLAVAYERMGRMQWAIEGYRQALLREPQFLQAAAAYYRLAGAPDSATESAQEP